ncbi:MAG: hypothetical protein ABIR29_03415 [Chthoniobacterales bacterium]
MNLSFLRYFNFKKGRGSEDDGGVALASRPITAIEKPASERYGKTVMPNVSRVMAGDPPGRFPRAVPVGNPSSASAASGGQRKISLGGNGSIALAAKADVAERTIALHLADLVQHLPAGVLQPDPVDPEKRVIFKASELERGMASGRPTVSLRAIFQQAPDFFVSDVEASDPREVLLPFGKVLEQFTAFQVRPDQVADDAAPQQFETPFLKMTIEDGERFGQASAPIPAPKPAAPVASEPEVPVVTAASEVVAEEPKTARPLRLTVPDEAVPGRAAAPAPIRLQAPSASAPIVGKKISLNGTGVPATERVPASCGSPVPTLLPSPFAPPASVRMPFKVSPPSNDLREPAQSDVSALKAAPFAFAFGGARVQLSLRNVLRELPPFQLSGPVDTVPETAKIEIPFSILEPQLALGRIAISPAQFQAALPEKFRALFKADATDQPVVLPLQEVLQNLPDESLQLRGDQEEIVLTETFETPFSTKAAEDAARMKVASGPIAKPPIAIAPSVPAAAAPAPVLAPKPVDVVEVAAVPAAPAVRSALQVAFDTDEELDAKSIVAHTSKLPGVKACAIVFSDGLSLAGNIPAEYQTEALCALAPSLVKRINDQMIGASLGPLNGITLYCAKTPVSFFAHGNICLAALHSAGEIAAEVRARLSCAAREVAKMYTQPAA